MQVVFIGLEHKKLPIWSFNAYWVDITWGELSVCTHRSGIFCIPSCSWFGCGCVCFYSKTPALSHSQRSAGSIQTWQETQHKWTYTELTDQKNPNQNKQMALVRHKLPQAGRADSISGAVRTAADCTLSIFMQEGFFKFWHCSLGPCGIAHQLVSHITPGHLKGWVLLGNLPETGNKVTVWLKPEQLLHGRGVTEFVLLFKTMILSSKVITLAFEVEI